VPTPQPHEYLVEVAATVNVTMSVDIDGTIRVREANFVIDKDDINGAFIHDQMTYRTAQLEGDLWDRILDDVPRDGEISTHDRWPSQLAPILDKEAVDA
jgi:hypothetical protein